MGIFEAIILGIVQGFAEFLPVSSSGHLTLLQNIFGIKEPSNITFVVILHIATLIPVFVVFWKDIVAIIKNPIQKVTGLIIIGTIPTVIIALLFKGTLDSIFESGKFLGVCFIITGILLMVSDRVTSGRKTFRSMNYVDATVVGVFQCLALPPGISRSGMTLCGSIFRNIDRRTAATYSFLLSIPAILGAMVLELKDVFLDGKAIEGLELFPTIFGFLAAMISGFFAIKVFLNFITKNKMRIFSYYVFVLGAFVIIDQLLLHIFFK